MPGRTGLQMRSLVTPEGEVRVSLDEQVVPAPAPDEVLVRVRAAPLNPSDLGTLFGPADLGTLTSGGTPDRPVVTARIPERAMAALAGRVGVPMPAGNEGAGEVIEAGDAPEARALLGRTVAMIGGGMYAQHRVVRAADVLVLPEGAGARDGAACFVNPLTVLGMVETMRRDGHTAIVHTAAASSLGLMLLRVCREEGIGLVCVVRRPEQERLLRAEGAEHVVDASAAGFPDALADAIAATGATIGFDATGGGPLAGRILSAMEVALGRRAEAFSRYGTAVRKQVYVYGTLDPRPLEVVRDFGWAWGIGGWLLFHFMDEAGPEVAARMRRRVVDGLTTTFATRYAAEVSLAEALAPQAIRAYARRATGQKHLIVP